MLKMNYEFDQFVPIKCHLMVVQNMLSAVFIFA